MICVTAMNQLPDPSRRQSLRRSLYVALSGLWDTCRRERNLQIQLAVAVVAIVCGALCQFSPLEWGGLALCIGFVLGMETMNSAVEAVVDLASPEWHSLAKRAKDAAAGATLVSAMAAVAFGLSVFGPRLLEFCGLWTNVSQL